MNRKKRNLPLKEIGGKEQEFRIHRATDNQFYWLSTDAVKPGSLIPAKWDEKVFYNVSKPARLSAAVFSNNTIHVDTTGVDKVTVWFPPKLVNYGSDVFLRINGGPAIKKTVTPNLDTLLENLYQTGDRQRMFFARLDFKL
jgi:hypothetical protein